ncbi:hypothetical protein ACYFX5_15345 [Bremerella sp. T1]|uniref:hypothetical protein n=1 Tax=Bremerella sp. TYQ1 TaxID=3119568 RepID=UPI001CCCA746|nr:hypothetical protein [Bremerella volcania]UBM34432.1 hypothetical protein LA756_17295 [Bremerella volcania]
MITPGKFLLSLLAAASVCVDVALAANLAGSEPSEGLFGCMLGLLLGQIGLIAAGWIRRPDAWPWWSLAMLGSLGLGSVLLATMDKIPLLHWTVVLGVFAVLSVALPMAYRISRKEATSQFSLAAIFALTTAATLVCMLVLQSDFPWQELPVALPGLMVWACPAMVVALTLSETKEDRQRQLVIGLGAILALSLTAAWMLPSLWNRLPLVIAWETFYLLIAGIVALQAIANDEALTQEQDIKSPTISRL